MFSNLTGLDLVMTNLLLMLLWDITVFILSIKIDVNYFNPSKHMYKEKKWEKSGKVYIKLFKVKKWKDFLPQYVGKNGFSKKHLKDLSSLSKDYIQQFIVETCRAEWNHTMCCMFSVVSIFVNSLINGIIFSVLCITMNFPFIIIQRYNRIRLNRLLKRCSSQSESAQYKMVNA